MRIPHFAIELASPVEPGIVADAVTLLAAPAAFGH